MPYCSELTCLQQVLACSVVTRRNVVVATSRCSERGAGGRTYEPVVRGAGAHTDMMEDTTFIIIQLFVVLSIIAGQLE